MMFSDYHMPLEPANSLEANMTLNAGGFKELLVAHSMRCIPSVITMRKDSVLT